MNTNELFVTGEIPFSAAARQYDLYGGVNHHEIRLRVEGTIDVAGGVADGTLLDDAIARLLDEVRIIRDGEEIVQPITGRDLQRLTERSAVRVLAPTTPATAGVQTTPFRADFVFPFSPKFIVNPVESALIAREIRNAFRLHVRWNRATSGGAGSAAGSGAFITGGDRVVTFPVEPVITVTEVYSLGVSSAWYEPRIYAEVTDQFSAATANLRFDLIAENPILLSVIETREGPNQILADRLNRVTLRSGSVQIIPDLPFEDLKALELALFPAVPDTETGRLGILWAAGGKLTNVLNPQALSQPRLTFDVDAPGTAPGIVRILNFAGVPTQNAR